MINSKSGHESAPSPENSLAFFDNLFRSQIDNGIPMIGYEVDFLQDQCIWFDQFVREHDGAAKWLTGMGEAAQTKNMSVQFCMSHPAAFLHALTLPSVTNGRASGDYENCDENLIQYGKNAIFFSALGIAPSKDNFWTVPEQPKPLSNGSLPPCDGGNRNTTNNFLHALVATLSTGPVGFSSARY